MKIKVINQKGTKVKDLDLKKEIFEIEPHKHAIHQVVVAHLAALRQGTADTKGRSEISGGGKKPYRQKGTGRARQGTIRAPHYVGGGTVFGPTPRCYAKKVNKKVKELALRSALSMHAQNGSLVVLDKIEISEIKTKNVVEILKNIGTKENKTVILSKNVDEKLFRSANNIPYLFLAKPTDATVYDILNCKKLVLTEDSILHYEEVLKWLVLK